MQQRLKFFYLVIVFQQGLTSPNAPVFIPLGATTLRTGSLAYGERNNLDTGYFSKFCNIIDEAGQSSISKPQYGVAITISPKNH